MALIIDLSKCDVCGACVNACPAHAITRKGNTVVIDESLCTLCKRCFDVCPSGAISEEKSAKVVKETCIKPFKKISNTFNCLLKFFFCFHALPLPNSSWHTSFPYSTA